MIVNNEKVEKLAEFFCSIQDFGWGYILTVSKTKVLVVNCHLQSIESSICVGDNMIYNQVGLGISNYLHR